MSNITWRGQTVRLPARQATDVYFMDTKPNAFYIQNKNETELFISMTGIATAENFDVEIGRNTTDVFGRPVPCSRISILNASDNEIHVSLYSAEDMFDMFLLKNFKADISGDILGQIAYNGIINGFKAGVSLPSGNNKIGTVDLVGNSLTALNNLLNSAKVSGKTNLRDIVEAIQNISINTGDITATVGDVGIKPNQLIGLTGSAATDLTAINAAMALAKGYLEDLRNIMQEGINVSNEVVISPDTPLNVGEVKTSPVGSTCRLYQISVNSGDSLKTRVYKKNGNSYSNASENVVTVSDCENGFKRIAYAVNRSNNTILISRQQSGSYFVNVASLRPGEYCGDINIDTEALKISANEAVDNGAYALDLCFEYS